MEPSARGRLVGTGVSFRVIARTSAVLRLRDQRPSDYSALPRLPRPGVHRSLVSESTVAGLPPETGGPPCGRPHVARGPSDEQLHVSDLRLRVRYAGRDRKSTR